MPREIQENHAIWSLTQAYAGLEVATRQTIVNQTPSLTQAYAGLEELHSARKDAAQKDGLVWVVATPGGGAQSVRLHLPLDWESQSDAELLAEIARNS